MSHPVVAYMISLAVGYWVLTLADKQTGVTKTLGKVFAWIIIVVSLLGPVCKVAGALMTCRENSSACGYTQNCPWTAGGWRHHGMGSSCVSGQCPTDGKDDSKMTAPMGKMMEKEKAAKSAK